MGRVSASESLLRLRYDWLTEMRNDQDVGSEGRPTGSVTVGKATRLGDSWRGHRIPSAVQETPDPIGAQTSGTRKPP
jgi:hypothetical protein